MSVFDTNGDKVVKLLVPVDSDISSGRAAQAFSAALALKPNVLILLHVYPPIPATLGGDEHRRIQAEREEHAAAVLEKAQALSGPVAVEKMILEGQVVESIVRGAHESEADVIVMVTDGHDGLADMLLGSVTERVLRATDTPMLVLRHRK